jgi:exopolysaccharide production protein ExoQ
MDSEHSRIEGGLLPPPGIMERTFVVLVLLFAAGGFLVLVSSNGEYDQAGGGLVFEAIWGVAYIVTFSLLFFRVRRSPIMFLKEFPIVLLPAMALASVGWSDDPWITFRRGIALWLTMMFGYYMARRFTLREQLHLLAWACGISIFFSFPFGLLHVGRNGDEIEGAWNGIFGQKNVLGSTMALSILVFLLLARVEPEKRWRMRVGIFAAFVLLVLSHSAGGIVVTIFMCVFLHLAKILRKSFAKALAGTVLAVMVGTIALFWVLEHWGAFTSALGKGETMSGRLQLWTLCVAMALRRVWLGYGYGAFWLGMHGPSFRILRVLPSVLNSRAHNVFLQTWLDLGLVGALLLAVIFAVYTTKAVFLVRRTRQVEAFWPLIILVFYLIYGFTETSLAGPNSISMMIFSSCIFGASAPLLERAVVLPGRESSNARVLRKSSDIGGTLPETSSA